MCYEGVILATPTRTLLPAPHPYWSLPRFMSLCLCCSLRSTLDYLNDRGYRTIQWNIIQTQQKGHFMICCNVNGLNQREHILDHSTYLRCLKHSVPQMHIKTWCFPGDTLRKEIVIGDNDKDQ